MISERIFLNLKRGDHVVLNDLSRLRGNDYRKVLANCEVTILYVTGMAFIIDYMNNYTLFLWKDIDHVSRTSPLKKPVVDSASVTDLLDKYL